MKIIFDIDADKILKRRGLGESKKAVKFLASEVERFCKPYVPMQTGNLVGSGHVMEDSGGVCVEYKGPYAHYQYKGEVMAGRAPKYYTGRPLRYHDCGGTGLRGKEWDKRMMANRRKDVLKSFANFVGGEVE